MPIPSEVPVFDAVDATQQREVLGVDIPRRNQRRSQRAEGVDGLQRNRDAPRLRRARDDLRGQVVAGGVAADVAQRVPALHPAGRAADDDPELGFEVDLVDHPGHAHRVIVTDRAPRHLREELGMPVERQAFVRGEGLVVVAQAQEHRRRGGREELHLAGVTRLAGDHGPLRVLPGAGQRGLAGGEQGPQVGERRVFCRRQLDDPAVDPRCGHGQAAAPSDPSQLHHVVLPFPSVQSVSAR